MTAMLPLRRGGAIALALLASVLVSPATAQVDAGGLPDPADVVRKELLVVDPTGTRLDGGGGLTPFGVELEGADECPGDSAHGQYRVDSFMVPVDVDPSQLVYTSAGPTPPHFRTYDGFQKPLHTLAGEPYSAVTTAQETEPGGPGPIRELPRFDFGVYEASPYIEDYGGGFPAGDYRIGISCTFGNGMTNLWETTVRVADDAGDEPIGIRWQVTGPQPADLETASEASSLKPALAFVALALLLAGVALSLQRSSRRAAAESGDLGVGGGVAS